MIRDLLQNVFDNAREQDSEGRVFRRSFREKLIKQQQVTKYHEMKNEICLLSHEGIEYVMQGDYKSAEECRNRAISIMYDLHRSDVRDEGIKDAAGQELVELVLVSLLAPGILDGAYFPEELPDPYDLSVSVQAYLAGITEFVGEMSRITNDRMLNLDVEDLEEKIELNRAYIQIAEEIYKTLFYNFTKGIAPSVLNSKAVRDFSSGFRRKVDLMRNILIEPHKRHTLQMSDTLVVSRVKSR